MHQNCWQMDNRMRERVEGEGEGKGKGQGKGKGESEGKHQSILSLSAKFFVLVELVVPAIRLRILGFCLTF